MSEQNNLTVYDEFTARHEAAYTGYVKYYTLKNPPPVEKEVKRDYVSQIIVSILAIVMAAAVIVSSTRTIDEFGTWVAIVMTEGGIMGYAFFRARRTASAERLEKTVKWATVGLVLTFIVALGANVDDTLKRKGVIVPDVVNTIINVLVAVSAPTLAFISSDILAIELMATDIRRRQADKEFEAAMREWKDGLNRSWAGQQKQWGVGKIEVEKPSDLSVQPVQLSDGHIGHGLGYKRESKAASIVKAHLDMHPEDIGLPVRELAAKLKIGKSTVASIIRDLRNDSEVQ